MTADSPFLSLARKWRPQAFAELVGHEYTVRVLQNAVRQQRLHHAFLFTGTRGVGKTTLARLVAKMVNCEQNQQGEPCRQCPMCRQIAEGRLLDMIELDAASHTQAEKMRELLEGAVYPPVQGRYKVFIIDEAHMLSKNAFAVMLKTLEEPPPYIKFVLATTDPQKLPATIMSRCLCFALRPLERAQIAQQLRKVLQAEKRQYHDDAVEEIARLARGSMRDALSILEQGLAHSQGPLLATAVRHIVGEADTGLIADILRAVAAADASAVPALSQRLTADGVGFDSVLNRLAVLIYKTSLAKAAPAAATDPEEKTVTSEAAALFDNEQLQALYEIAVRGRRQLPWAPDEQTGFEMTLLRMMLFSPCRANSLNTDTTTPAVSPTTAGTAASATAPQTKPALATINYPPAANADLAATWQQIVAQLSGTAQALAQSCTPKQLAAASAILTVDRSQQKSQRLLLPELEKQLRQLLHMDFSVTLQNGADDMAATARNRELAAAAAGRPVVRDILAAMPEAKLMTDSVRLRDNAGQTSDREI